MAASRIVHLAEHNPQQSRIQVLMMGQLGRHWACSRAACEGSVAFLDLVVVACDCSKALRESRLGWSRRHRSRYPGWVLARSSRPASSHISIAPVSGTLYDAVQHVPESGSCPQPW